MLKDKIGVWIRAARLFAISASVMPIVLGGVLAFSMTGKFNVMYFILTLLATILIHTGANMKNDRDDYINKVDTIDSLGMSGVLVNERLEPQQLNKVSLLLLSIGSLIGIIIVFLSGWPIMILGLIGVAGGYCYTGKPLELKYKGLGTPLIFLLFGPLPVMGAYYVQTGAFSIKVALIAIPIGLLTTAILHVNDIRDIYSDSKAGIKTLSNTVGRENAKKIYYFLVVMAPISLVILAILKYISFISMMLSILTLPIIYKNIRRLHKYKQGDTCSDIITLDQETAKLQTLFGALLIISILSSCILLDGGG